MRAIKWMCASLAACAWLAASAQAATTARIVETDPPGAEISLDRGQSFFVRIAYTADAPVSIWARPYFHGTEVPAMTNASVPHSGSGEALGWFEFIEPGEVDEIRVKISAPDAPNGEEIARYPVHITGTGQAGSERARVTWVERLSREEADIRRQLPARGGSGGGGGSVLILFGFALAVPLLLVGGFAAPAWALWRWRGGWRIAAAAPAALMAFVVLRFFIDTARDPTSHNLWPFEVLMFGAASVGCIALLVLARRLLRVEA